ncbi:hypothetical protein BGW36DRAFT_423257 [Talaromyces proteolyticus]|uniref:Myb-like domain-containing protein n=1 Tax=Talaromyces proteolyticus TaxID=1131652 RepID=A0AAD4KY57_9EURO|nr:uncharacterized protein BGW36DRAFT_423257 [Talaromyces proteolyticus]KAH8703706.1 hypothetical protein BGW36DRAFT_423257 [Talaromyces proteolyticus]
MTKPGGGSSSSPPDESSFSQTRDMPSQLPGLRIAPLRQPVTRILNSPIPSKSEITTGTPSTTATTAALTTTSGGTSLPERLPTLEEFLNAARTTDADLGPFNVDSNIPPPPKTILPAFINLQAVEKLPYVFDQNGLAKRRRLDVSGDHFASEHLQLPVPQTQQNDKKLRPFGPYAILNGLNEPPPNAALFPPIEPGSLPPMLSRPAANESESMPPERQLEKQSDKRELRLEEILDSNRLDEPVDELNPATGQKGDPGEPSTTLDAPQAKSGEPNDPMSPKTRGRSRKNLRRWTEQETTDLLKGVVKCGIGNWTAILQQPELNFNKRTASNLKDRFRVCCPWAYGAADPNEATRQIQDTLANALINAESLSSGAGGKILLPDPRPKDNAPVDPVESSASKLNEPSPTTRPKQSLSVSKSPLSQSHKSKSTLSSLGIPEPYFTIKSKRRSRRPFTSVEDEALLKGYAVHGFQWTLIQQDKHLNLSHRKATDLRDRFRTKFPSAYREGGSVSGKSIEAWQPLSVDSKSPSNMTPPALSASHRKRPPASATSSSSSSSSASSMPPPPRSKSAPEKRREASASSVTESMSHSNSLLPPLPLSQPGMLMDANGTAGSNNSSSTGGSLSFSMDDTAIGASSSVLSTNPGTSTGNRSNGNNPTASVTTWVDNTLPPLNWDDLT